AVREKGERLVQAAAHQAGDGRPCDERLLPALRRRRHLRPTCPPPGPVSQRQGPLSPLSQRQPRELVSLGRASAGTAPQRLGARRDADNPLPRGGARTDRSSEPPGATAP